MIRLESLSYLSASLLWALLVMFTWTGCEAPRAEHTPQPTTPQATKKIDPDPKARDLAKASRLPAANDLLIAIGDVHGDFEAARRALRLAGAIDNNDRWIGGSLTVVQTGDVLDRGDGEREILDLFTRLEREASAAGGRFIALLGNHELMNSVGDVRYVTPDGAADFADIPHADPRLQAAPEPLRGRLAAFLPGGIYARQLAERRVAVIVGDTLFVHGGVLPEHVNAGLDHINSEAKAWLLGQREQPSPLLVGPDSPVWSRHYSTATPDCARLSEVLQQLGLRRMVVGHTVQKQGITSACDGRIWRIDVGMAAHYGGGLEVLEIRGDHVQPRRP